MIGSQAPSHLAFVPARELLPRRNGNEFKERLGPVATYKESFI
jgi:hypothetical protein